MRIPTWAIPRRRPLLMVLIIGLALLSGSCGGADDEIADPATTDEVPTSTTTADTTSTESSAIVTEVPPTTVAEGVTLQVYFSAGDRSDCSLVQAFDRTVNDRDDPIRAALDQLVGGPLPEESAVGAGSFFSSETANVVSSVTLSDGLLLVDFIDLRQLVPDASTSCGSAALLSQLNSTALQFPEVDRVRYRIAGSCDEFAAWLQRECFDSDRSGEQLDVPTNERASFSGCMPPPGDELPDGRWFGLVEEADEGQLSFDLACWFTGIAAEAAAGEDGEESPPPNDYYVRNASDRLRTLTVAPTAEVAWLADPGNPESLTTLAYGDWRDQRIVGDLRPGVWLDIEDGLVVTIEEQYVP